MKIFRECAALFTLAMLALNVGHMLYGEQRSVEYRIHWKTAQTTDRLMNGAIVGLVMMFIGALLGVVL